MTIPLIHPWRSRTRNGVYTVMKVEANFAVTLSLPRSTVLREPRKKGQFARNGVKIHPVYKRNELNEGPVIAIRSLSGTR